MRMGYSTGLVHFDGVETSFEPQRRDGTVLPPIGHLHLHSITHSEGQRGVRAGGPRPVSRQHRTLIQARDHEVALCPHVVPEVK